MYFLIKAKYTRLGSKCLNKYLKKVSSGPEMPGNRWKKQDPAEHQHGVPTEDPPEAVHQPGVMIIPNYSFTPSDESLEVDRLPAGRDRKS